MNQSTKPAVCGTCRQRAMVLVMLPEYATSVTAEERVYELRVPDLVVWQCANCGTIRLTEEASARVDESFRQAAGLLTPEAIQTQRTALGMNHEYFAELLGVSVGTLDRWERGLQMPSRSTNKLLRVVFAVPEARAVLSSTNNLPTTV